MEIFNSKSMKTPFPGVMILSTTSCIFFFLSLKSEHFVLKTDKIHLTSEGRTKKVFYFLNFF